MELGAFSVSLAVKDLMKSKAFYEALGFSSMDGDPAHNYLIMKNGTTLIGLFQGMFEDNILTFNPGWNSDAQEVNSFDDVRDIQEKLQDSGIKLDTSTDPESDGPAHIILKDPDGNVIMLDQHRGRG